MESNAQENVDSKAEFRKSLNDGSNKKYRRRSPVSRSSYSPDGSSQGDHSSSPVPSRKDTAKVADDRWNNDDDREVDRDYRRGQSGRSSESYKHSDRQSSRSYHRHDDHSRRDKHVDDYGRDHSKSSYHSGWDLRDNLKFDHSDKDHRLRDYPKDVDTYTWEKYDGSGHRNRDIDSSERAGSGRRHANIENGDGNKNRDKHREDGGGREWKTDHRRSSGDHKTDSSAAYERHESTSRRDSSGQHLKEASRRNTKELDGERYTKEEKKRHDRGGYKEKCFREPKERPEDSKVFSSNDQELGAKKSKLFNSTGPGKNGILADEKQSTSKPTHETAETVATEQAYVTDSDIDAAKIAATKAAELVNRNLIGTGYMSTDQKKKLLWGNKKNTTVEESACQWNTTIFGDCERQEKFNKLMSLRLHWYLWPIVGRERLYESGSQARQPRCGKAAGRAPVGFGEAIHSWTAPKRWSNCWTWSLKVFFRYLCSWNSLFHWILFYCAKQNICKMLRIHIMGICWSVTMTSKVARYVTHEKLSLIRLSLECFLDLLEPSAPSQSNPMLYVDG